MKIEIKLNQEQFDLLVTSIIQIAQNSAKMAEAWGPKEEPTQQEKPNTTPQKLYKFRSDSHIYMLVWGTEPADYKGQKAHILREAIKATGAEWKKKGHNTYVRYEDIPKVVEWMNEHKEG